MKPLKDVYRGTDMFELARRFNATYDDVSVFGFVTFLNDNGYEISNYEQEEPGGNDDVLEDWRREWMSVELGELAMKPNALNDTAKISGFSSKRVKE